MTVVEYTTLTSVTHPIELLHHGSNPRNCLLTSHKTTVRPRYDIHRKIHRLGHIRARLSTLLSRLVVPGKQSLEWVPGRNHHSCGLVNHKLTRE